MIEQQPSRITFSSLVIAFFLMILPASQAQQSLQMQEMSPTGSSQQGQQQPCDERLSPCMDQSGQNSQFQSNYPSYDLNSRPYVPGMDNQYNFGSGQPLNLTPQEPEQQQVRDDTQTKPIKLPPEPPTEFQKFVSADIGRMLPLYGSQFFVNAPATFAPLDKVPVTPGYTIGPGDELLLRGWGSISFYLRETVDRSGNIYIPHVGLIQVAGIKFSDIRNFLDGQISNSFKKFELSVEMGHLRSIQVFVVGRTRRPGTYTISSLSSLVNALFVSGGPSNAGSMRKIQVRRGSSVVTELDLYNLLLNGDKSKDISLVPGDVIYIPPAGARIAITGSVSQPAIYEIRSGETVGDVLDMAGGLTSLATLASGELERIDSHGGRHVIEVHFDENGLKTPVQDGDILRVLSIIPKFDNAVTLRGNVANPGRYPWHAGMRIRDLIPDKESLITRNYWKHKNDLVYIHAEGGSTPSEENPNNRSTDMPSPQSDTNTSTSADNIKTSDNITSLGSSQSEDGEQPSPGALKPSNLSPKADRFQSSDTDYQSIASQNGSPSHQFSATNKVEKQAPEIDWDYAVIERMNTRDLTTFLKPFNLGKVLLDNDPSENFELEPGDVVTIFSQADIHVPQDRRTKFVRLEGEFKASGVYSVKPGETLRELVQRAGGITSGAYLYGSSFTRESTRRQQQARLNEYYTDLEQEIDRASAERSNSAVNVQEAATLSASLESERALAEKLHQMRATGRIVLNLAPNSSGLNDIPDLPLEDGDSFVVPSMPSSISVVGAVYDQNAFIFENGKKADGYLELAGGIMKNADGKHAFIIRADGSVVSRKSSIAKAKGGLEDLAMNPGDTLVIPESVNKTTILRGLTDWSAVFSQFGLGAAAINVLH